MTDLPNTPAGVLRLMPSTLDEVNRFANRLIQSVKEGEENALDILVQIRAMEKAFKIVTDRIRNNYIIAADKYPGERFEFKGNEIQKGDTKTDYDYTVCGDTVWEQRKSILDAAKTLLDERQEFLRTLKEPLTTLDEGTGEIITIYPPKKTTVQGLKIFLK